MAYSPESIVAVSIILPLLALIAVCLRFWVRLRLFPSYVGIDDWLCVAACIFVLGDGANLVVGAVRGYQGRDYPNEIPPDRESVESKSDYAQVVLEKPLYGLMKLSVLFFYRRIFSISRAWRLFNDAMIALIIVWTLFYFLAEILECGAHPSILWTPHASRAGKCFNLNNLNLSFAVTDVAFDALVVIMPYPCIRKLHMSRRERLGVAGIFLLGTLSTAAAIVRLGFIAKAFTQDYGGSGNHHAAGTPPAVWSTVEAAVGVLAACLPPLGPLIRKAPSPRRLSSSWRSLIRERKESRNGLRMVESPPDSEGKKPSADEGKGPSALPA